MGLQMRISPQDGRWYSPDRDLAYCMHHLAGRAVAGLDLGRREPWVQRFIDSRGITEDQLCEAAAAYARYLNGALFEPAHAQPFSALEAAGFFNLPEDVQTLFLAKLGQVFTSAFFVSARDVTNDPSQPPVDKRAMSDAVSAMEIAVKERARAGKAIQG